MQRFQYVFLDSGVGGLPYLQLLTQLTPSASCVYVADTKHFPYGEKTLEEVIKFSHDVTEKIIKSFNPSVIIIACNTISVSALSHLRSSFQTPFVGTVPAIKQGVLKSKNKRIGILATERTVNDMYTQKLIDEFGSGCTFFMRADSTLVSYIEDNLLAGDEEKNKQAVFPALDFFKTANADTIVLGCTHFLNLKHTFMQQAEPDIQIADSLEGVVRQALRISPPQETQYNQHNAFFVTAAAKETAAKYKNYAASFNLNFAIL